MSKTSYILEVVEYITEKEGRNGWYSNGGRHKHTGYIRKHFNTQEEACLYYNKHNPHMKPLNIHETYCSDADPTTNLLYIVRKYDKMFNLTIEPL